MAKSSLQPGRQAQRSGSGVPHISARCQEESRLRQGPHPGREAGSGDTGVVLDHAVKVLASAPADGDYVANGIWGVDLARKLATPEGREAHFLIDVRSRDAYGQGHIEGAVHMELAGCISAGNLERLPRGRKIVVVCDIGDVGPQVVSGLKLLGYDAAVLRTGMNGWVRNGFRDQVLADISASYPVENTPPDLIVPAQTGLPFTPPGDEDYPIIEREVKKAFASMPLEGDYAFNLIHPAAVNQQLEDALAEERIFILDLRREEDFEGVGHIRGAVQADFAAALLPANLERLPRDRKIITVCYTGNTAGQLVLMLRMLGYDAAAMKYGMVGWKMTPTTFFYRKDLDKAGNPVVRS